ncbi:hypothetical protein SLEP1_g8698 [Rubroshorea leprosula]|uniref:UBX domain-containing protein n=1 Tax=Rubroshorea leprosula TaxID=152421 RepID=A0AAV5IBT5_9ROSI|nr:hypothetical protein SLEP1_g8698 [Rubroshorea leprosula]
MARPNQEAIDMFMTITGVPEAIAVQKLEEHGNNLNVAVNAHFSEGDGNMSRAHERSIASPEDNVMAMDDPAEVVPPRLPQAATRNPSSFPGANFRRSFLDVVSNITPREPFVSRPREVREIPIEDKDGNEPSSRSRNAPIIEDVTETAQDHGPGMRETAIVKEVDDDSTAQGVRQNDSFQHRGVRPHAPAFHNVQDSRNDIEEEMIKAAIEASKWDVEELSDHHPQHNPSHSEDAELAEAVSLSLKTAEQEKALRELGWMVGESEAGASEPAEVQREQITALNERPGTGSSSIQDEAGDVEEQPLTRHRSSVGSMESSQVGLIESSPPSSPEQEAVGNHPPHDGNTFTSDEWGGISSEEHDEAVMLEAAMFGGIPDGGYHFAYAPHQFMQPRGSYLRPPPHPPSPSSATRRLIREQQDDEYLASLQADREKELKAMQEAEVRRLEKEAARKAALEEERRKEEEARWKMKEEQEFERQLAAKEASLPQEPAADNENAVTLMVRMPDASRRGRRFLKSDRLQSLFDFIDIGRVVKPGTYRLVRPYPRRAFSNADGGLTLNELGLTSKQEALFLESI